MHGENNMKWNFEVMFNNFNAYMENLYLAKKSVIKNTIK
jgi:hypothetical protein